MQMTQESIDAFLEHQTRNGASKDSLRQRKGFVSYLYQWLPDDKLLTRECLAAWREDMQQKGYTQQTILNYVKGINMYLDYMGWSEIRFNRGKAKDIRDITFGYLTPIEPTEKRHRKDVVWRCKCKCGNIVEMPATRLLTGNTLSCGCMKVENILSASKHIAGTHLFQSLKEDAPRSDNLSGYVGVSPKRDKWFAHITYRGTRYHLGTYSNIEDAIKARARAKELVMFIGNAILLFLNLPLANVWAKITLVPDRVLFPIITIVALLGVYGLNNSMFDVICMFIFGLIGYALKKADFPLAPMLLTFILGDQMEYSLVQSMTIFKGDVTMFLRRPICAVILAIIVFVLVFSVLSASKRKEILGTEESEI